MRIIAGKYKGKQIQSPKSDNIRPTGDKVRQALFTKLHFDVVDSVVLDLFSGTGALGIEALSNGAEFVYFVDKDRRSISLTKSNVLEVGAKNCKIINADYKTALNMFNIKFDIILVDPPYASGVYDDVLNLILQNNLLNENGIVVCEHPNGMNLIANGYEVTDKKRYGTVELTYLKVLEK